MVSLLDSGAEGPVLKLQLRRCRVTVLGKLLTLHYITLQTVNTHHASVHQAVKSVAVLLMVARVTAGLTECNGSLPSGL